MILKLIEKLAADLSLDAAEQAPVASFKTHAPGHNTGVYAQLVCQGRGGSHRG